MMTAGRMDQRITLQTSVNSRDAVGGLVETWSTLATVWARVAPLSGKRIAQAQQIGSSVTKQIEIRWRAGISASLRIQFADGRVAKVSWVEESKRDGFIVLVCEDING